LILRKLEGEDKEKWLKAMEYMTAVNRLTDSQYLPSIQRAIETGDEDLFMEVCEEADIPVKLRVNLRNAAFRKAYKAGPIW
jgi:hypothetical protein